MYLILSLLLWAYVGGSKLNKHLNAKSKAMTYDLQQIYQIRDKEYVKALSALKPQIHYTDDDTYWAETHKHYEFLIRLEKSEEKKQELMQEEEQKRQDDKKEIEKRRRNRERMYEESGRYYEYVFGSRWKELLDVASNYIFSHPLERFSCIWDMALQINFAQHGKYYRGWYKTTVANPEEGFDKVFEELGITYLNTRDMAFRTIKVIEECLLASSNNSRLFRMYGSYNNSDKLRNTLGMPVFPKNTTNEYICSLSIVDRVGCGQSWRTQVKDIVE